MKFINSTNEIIENIKMFNRERIIHSDHAIFDQAGKFKCWYAFFDNQADEWIFGPSKYIGYTGMNKDYYTSNYSELDGKLTEKQLVKFSSAIDSELYSFLESKLFEALSVVNRTPGKSVKIKVIQPNDDAEIKTANRTGKQRFSDSRDCSFFIKVDVDKSTVMARNVLLNDDTVKFDLQYGEDVYIINLVKKAPTGYYEGTALRQHDREKIAISAIVRLEEESLEITGLEWFEGGTNYMWHVSVDKEEIDEQ